MTEFADNPEACYLALIGDLVGSRELENRAAVQRRLVERLGELSESLEPRLLAPVEITSGDELEGLLRDPGDAVLLMRELSDVLRPAGIRFGLGFGSLSTAVAPGREDRRVAELDGPCFHRARTALDRSRERSVWMAVEGLGEAEDLVLSSLGELLGKLREGWTDKQAQYLAAARNALQKDVAERFGVAPSVVSESLKAAEFEACLRAEAALQTGLEQFGKNAESRPD